MLPGPQTRGRGGPLQFPRHPSDRSTPHAPGGSWAPAPGSMVPSVAFARPTQARLPLGPARAGVLVTTLQASLHAADRSVAPPPLRGVVAPLRRRDLARRREPCYRGPWRLPGPDSHRLAAVSLSLGYAADLLSLWRPNYWTHVGRGNQGSLLPSACTLWDAFIEFTGVTSTF